MDIRDHWEPPFIGFGPTKPRVWKHGNRERRLSFLMS